jgi:hypothetical protein
MMNEKKQKKKKRNPLAPFEKWGIRKKRTINYEWKKKIKRLLILIRD